MRMTRTYLAYISLIFALLLSAPAAAQTSANAPVAAQTPAANCPHPATAQKAPVSAALMAARRAQHQACAADMTKYCADVPRGCGRPMQCLRSHMTQLSSACTNAMAQVRAARLQSH